MIVVVVLDHNVCMLVVLIIIVCQGLGLQSVGQINVLASYSRDHSNRRSVLVNGLTGCGATEAARVSNVANAHS